jgi:hypothetical protein
MSWRFRKTFKVLPGVKLNLTARGLSATVGGTPFSINVGPRGVYRNVSIPGTGIWDRQRIGGPSSQPSGIQPPTTDYAGSPAIPSLPPSIPVSPSPATEIHSASTELLTSEGLEHLRWLLTDAYNERDELAKEISSATLESNTATKRYQKWERGFFMKRLFKQSFTTRKKAADTAIAKLEELQEQLRLTTIATEIAVDREQAEPYYRMRDDFAAVSGCQKVWNVLTEKSIDRIAERSTASTAITRHAVSFSLGVCDLIRWEQKVPHLPNHTGGDMYLYPGFILYRASRQAFALIEFHDVSLNFVSTQFTEVDTLPSDTQVIGHTWAKSNKDGTPDRRFAENYQIPVTDYGSLLFSSPDGLDVRYLCSNAALGERFAKAWAVFRMSFSSQKRDRAEAANESRPSEGFEAALNRFWTAHDEFVNSILAQNCNGKMRREEFMAYMATVMKFITAARGYLEIPAPSLFRAARADFQRAIERFEVARTHFERSVCEGRMDTEMFTAYSNALATFVYGIREFQQTPADGGTTGRRRGRQA